MSSSSASPGTARTRLLAAALIPLGLLATLGAQADAIANRFVAKIGVGGINFKLDNLLNVVLRPAGGAGKSEIRDLIVAIIALVLLTAICVFAFGVMKTMSGRRGGLEAIGQVVFALIIGIAGFSVLA